MRLWRVGPWVWLSHHEPTRVEAYRAFTAHPDHDSENAQAVRECASQARDDDPEPGAFYGLSPAPDMDPTHG